MNRVNAPLAFCADSSWRGCFARRSLAGEPRGVLSMLDVFMLVIGIGFFALAIGYAVACERL